MCVVYLNTLLFKIFIICALVPKSHTTGPSAFLLNPVMFRLTAWTLFDVNSHAKYLNTSIQSTFFLPEYHIDKSLFLYMYTGTESSCWIHEVKCWLLWSRWRFSVQLDHRVFLCKTMSVHMTTFSNIFLIECV